MNRKMVFYMLGKIIQLEAALLLFPAVCSLIYRETAVWAFVITIIIAVILGFSFTFFNRTADKIIFAKEGFAIVSLAWIVISALGALPFCISGEIPSYVDAFFETVSGFTTTGASILPKVEEISSKGILFWRSFTHWMGGMGVIVLVMAILPSSSGRSIHILRAEVPGPIVGKLVPKISTTAKILYLIYFALTVVQIILLCLGGMPLYESLLHTFGTAGTGGFGIKNDSVGGYSPYIQWVIAIFMLIFGVNFNLYYLILMRKVRSVLKSEELWTYIGIVAVSTTIITVNIFNTAEKFGSFSSSLRHAAFQVSSIITTTGYATADFNLWPGISKTILLLLMFIGGCAGSTAGGLKVSRVVLLFKQIKTNLKHSLHPRSSESICFEGKNIDNAMVYGILSYLAIYVLCYVTILIILGFDSFNLETNISAAASCFNNVGPALGAAGPASSYAEYSVISKITLSIAMLLGRLEIYPLLLLFSSYTWKRSRNHN